MGFHDIDRKKVFEFVLAFLHFELFKVVCISHV